MRLNLSSLRARLAFLLVLIMLPIFVLMLLNAVEARKHEARDMQAAALRMARLVLLEQREMLAGARQLLPGLAQLPNVRSAEAGAACHRDLAGLLEQYPYYANFGVSNTDGLIRCSALPMDVPVHIGDRDYFQRALETGDFAIGSYQIGRLTGKSAINLGYPLRDERGRVDGVVFAALDLAWLSRKLTEISLPAETTVTILDANGSVLAHQPDPEQWFGRSVRDAPFAQLILTRGAEGTAESIDAAGVPRLYAFTPLHTGDSDSVYVSVGIPHTIAYADLDSRFKRNLLVLFLIATVVSIVACVGTHAFVLRPLRILACVSERLGNGDLSARVAFQQNSGVFVQLGQAFDQMAAALQQRHAQADTQDQELRRVNRALQTLSAGNHALVRAFDEPSLLQEMCRVAVEIGGYRIAWVGYVEHDDQQRVRPVAQAGIDATLLSSIRISWASTEPADEPVGKAIRTGDPCVAHELQTDSRYRLWHEIARGQGIRSLVSLPLRAGQEVLGVITVCSEDRDAFDAQELERLLEMAEDLAYGITSLRTGVEHLAAQATILRLAYYDSLTDLPNHASLQEWLNCSVSGPQSQRHAFAMLLFDLNRLRDINDTLGFEAGNSVIKETGQRISQALGQGAFIARMRGDEFAVVLPEADADSARQVALDILKILNQPIIIDDFSLVVRASVGIVLFPDHGTDAEQLIRHADGAMQLAKISGNICAMYSAGQDSDKKHHLALASDLHRALENDGLELYFQPKVAMQSGRVSGFEALARWRHPVHGMISPDEFIPLAERTGIIRPLTDWVLETALRQSRAWWQAGIRLPIAVNLSTCDLQDAQLLDKIEGWYASRLVVEGMLELEITESAIMADPAGALEVLTRIRALGIPLYIDDFGTGYSSLGYLKKLPVTAMKIDKSFVVDMMENADSATIVRSTITLAHDLGIAVVAEGVEDESVWEQLKALGCDSAQGYYMGRPMPLAQVDVWLKKSPWGMPDVPEVGQQKQTRR
ncbi:MAG: EAL domain-containing protein [Thiogranum sp.]|nr:EAL domain-containing protein [Thiogranum sp.]